MRADESDRVAEAQRQAREILQRRYAAVAEPNERTARAADAQRLAGRGLLGPGGRRAIAVQHEFNDKLTACRIETAGGVVARGGLGRAFRDLDAIRADGGQCQRLRRVSGEKELHMGVKRRGHEVREVVAGEGDAGQQAGNALDARNGQHAHLQVVAHALHVQIATGH
ncbi:hypothetical protein G6F68_011015 [Rhizopus microsporus]|nr:hypothetical protein G6F68_011015 [Rhizopus microsporus]